MDFDFEDGNPVSPPKLRVEPGHRVVREACALSLPVHAGEVTRALADVTQSVLCYQPILRLM